MITAFLAYAVITLFAFAFNSTWLMATAAPAPGRSHRSPPPSTTSTRAHSVHRGYVAMVVISLLGDVEGARATPLHRDRRRARRLSSLFVLAIGIVTQPERRLAQRASYPTSSRPRCYRSPAREPR